MTDKQITTILDKAEESLRAAVLLAEEEFLDFSVSRAYYTMFYTAEALLLYLGLFYSSHSAGISANGREYSKTKKLDPRFHTHLIAIQEFRNQGDYFYGSVTSPEQVKNAIEWANEFLDAALNYLITK